MHLARRLLPLLLLAPLTQGPPAAAQPWASESARLAGRAALEAVRRNQFLEADSLSLAADPVVRKLVVWNRVQNRQGGASAAEIVAWLDANPDWPFPLSVAMRAEEALVAEPDDALALRQFGRAPPRTLAGLDRYVAALLRAGRPAEAQAALARGWRDAAGDGFAEQGLLARHGGLLTVEDHWQRADRQFWDGQPGAAARMMPLLDATRRAIIEARLAAASSRAEPPSAIRDIGAALEVARQQRRADRDADAAATWIAAEPLQQGLSADAARAIWVERQVLSRKLLRLGDAATAYRIAAGPPTPPKMMVIALGRLGMREFDVGSDADLVFALPQADADDLPAWSRTAERLIEILSAYTGEGMMFAVDSRLRPNGRAGALVQTDSAFRDYFERRAEAWEGMAYMKSHAVAGDIEASTAFLNELQQIDWRRYGQSGRSRSELRRMRLRLEREQGLAQPLKAGAGGYYDIDFILMYLRLKSAGFFFKQLSTPQRIEVIEKMGHLSHADALFLRDAATFYRALDHGLRIIFGHAEADLPKSPLHLDMLTDVIGRWTPPHLHDQPLPDKVEQIRSRTRELFDRLFAVS
ncbi:MAG: hypothetical protein B7Z53_01140 [Rhodospirillales bacterium 12-71-4]|nr:MAG: hypothetical protein B7Z53_01140 [Rhodospirillales bacterium 12-71-4]